MPLRSKRFWRLRHGKDDPGKPVGSQERPKEVQNAIPAEGKRKPPRTSSSRLTNRMALPPKWKGGVDGRSTWVRRYHDLIGLHVDDLGGDVSTAELSIIRRAAALTVELERYDLKFAKDGEASIADLDAYQRGSNTLRRLLETTGLKRVRVVKDITLASIIEGKVEDGDA